MAPVDWAQAQSISLISRFTYDGLQQHFAYGGFLHEGAELNQGELIKLGVTITIIPLRDAFCQPYEI